MTRLTSDVEAVAETFGNGAIGVLAELVSLLVISATMVLVDRRLGLLLLLTLIPVMRIVIALQTRYRRANYRVREELGSRNADLQENLQGLEVVQMFRCQSRNLDEAMQIALIRERVEKVRKMRLASRDKGANKMANRAHQMREVNIGSRHTIATPCVSSESREYLPVGLLDNRSTVSNLAFALYSTPLWTMALIASRLYLVWIATVCGKLKADFRYSNTLGWNTFPLPPLTQNNRKDLTRCAEDILLAREAHFPATIAQLYDPKTMPENLRHAHDRNDECLERIVIGRRFKNDTERLEKLFGLYVGMTGKEAGGDATGAMPTTATVKPEVNP